VQQLPSSPEEAAAAPGGGGGWGDTDDDDPPPAICLHDQAAAALVVAGDGGGGDEDGGGCSGGGRAQRLDRGWTPPLPLPPNPAPLRCTVYRIARKSLSSSPQDATAQAVRASNFVLCLWSHVMLLDT
jgi:hypothetical protein